MPVRPARKSLAAVALLVTLALLLPANTPLASIRAASAVGSAGEIAPWSSATGVAVAPIVSISAQGTAVVLTWAHASSNLSYQIWRHTVPYFDLVSPPATLVASGLPPAGCDLAGLTITCSLPGDIGEPTTNHFYVVRGIESGGANTDSNRTGEFDFALTPGSAAGHESITQYDGPQTCVACHATEANDALHSEHMRWDGKWQQINTYCTAPAPADYACLSCHASTGKVTNQTVNDVDCLVCHNDTYKRSLQPLDIARIVTDWQDVERTYWTPSKNAEGNYTMQPRFDLMPAGTTMVELAQNVHLPTRASCLRCHAGAGGGDGVKRGDISSANTNPSLTSDVHMSPQGANLTCQDCHVTTDHQIPGKGIDLRIAEGGAVKDCADCHGAKPHGTNDLNSHTDRVACQTCHIPTFAKDVPTEMSRDWTHPEWNPASCSGQGAWIGTEVKASNVVPQYTFWNGTSYVYNLADVIDPQPDGSYAMAKANGSINGTGSKLYPIKLHQSVQPRHDASGRMVQYDVLWNFMTGKYQEAADRGVTFMGLTGPSSWVRATAEQLITHGVEPSANALACADCHSDTAQMDLQALGYTLKGPASSVCTQCHTPKEEKPFSALHTKHVSEKGYDCVWCHTFSRPERGLKLP